MIRSLLLAALLAAVSPALAGTPPVIDDAALVQAATIARMEDADPTSRILQLLAARELSDAALFALASTHPNLVEQLTDETYRLGIDYLATLPPPELHRVRIGETVIRTERSMTSTELRMVDRLCEVHDVKRKKFQAMRVGPLEGRIYRVELTAQDRKQGTLSKSIELAWPSTPERDEESRQALTRHFGARPSKLSMGAGADLPLMDGSFEEAGTLGTHWQLGQALLLGPDVPVNDVNIDSRVAIDGLSSVRFHGTDKTRMFVMAYQQITVVPGMKLRARAQIKAENLRVEYQQRPTDVYLAISFLDIGGNPVAPPLRAPARLATHTWEPLELIAEVPMAADIVQIELLSAVSGTAWFDGVTLELTQ